MNEVTRSLTQHGTLRIVETACSYSADRSTGVITIQSDSPNNAVAHDELVGSSARHMAIAYAAVNGVADPRINGNIVGPYPVNNEDVPLENVVDPKTNEPLPPTHPLMQVAAYRVDIRVIRKLV